MSRRVKVAEKPGNATARMQYEQDTGSTMGLARGRFFNNTRGFSRADLYELASRRIVRRGLDYARAGRVINLRATPDRLEARVVGTGSEPYVVCLQNDGEKMLASCSCPFDWEPFCKHAIAVLAAHFELEDESGEGASTGDGTTVLSPETLELAVRIRRASSGGVNVRRLEGDDFFGIFEVNSPPSDRTYRVEIRSLSELVNKCACLDYRTSMLGTCKHIEAVLAAQRKRAKREFALAASRPPSIAQVLADWSDVPRIRMIMPTQPDPALIRLASEFFDCNGYFLGDPVDDFRRLLTHAQRHRRIVIYSDAVELSERTATERRARNRSDEIRRTVMANSSHIPGIKTKLYPYQIEGTAFLAAAGRGLLGDEMGLGKTVQAIAADRVLRSRGEVHRTLVVCPASLKSQWASEIRRFCGLECLVVTGSPSDRLSQYRQQKPFTIANYEQLLRDRKRIEELAPDLLILDEAQRIRNWRTKTAEAVKDIRTPFAFVLTGTPLQNRLDDLYSVMQVVDRRVLGPLWAYNEQFVIRDRKGRRILGYRNLDQLRRRLRSHVLRRTKEEVRLQLPERIDSRFSVGITPAQKNLMNEGMATAAMLAAIAERRPLTPEEQERLIKAMQIARMACNAAGLVDKETEGSPKLDEFEQLIRDLCLDEGRKIVVFSEWEKFCRMAAERAERLKIPFVRFHGSVPTNKRGSLIAKFRDDPGCRIFFSTDAGGLGLNLQFASTVINLELPWNPAVLDQRIGRLHRHGQIEPVHVFHLVTEESFESGLEGVLITKREVFDAALDKNADAVEVHAPTSLLMAVRTALDALEVEDEWEGKRKPVAVDDDRDAKDPTVTPAACEIMPKADAKVTLDKTLVPVTEEEQQRREWLTVAKRRLTAASTLAEATLRNEAMTQAHEAMIAVARSLAADQEARQASPPARLIYEVLVPRGLLGPEQAKLISRAERLVRVFSNIAEPVPKEIQEITLFDARRLFDHALRSIGDPLPLDEATR